MPKVTAGFSSQITSITLCVSALLVLSLLDVKTNLVAGCPCAGTRSAGCSLGELIL